MADTLKLIYFAGQIVPDEGLVLATPQNMSLKVWPDGHYALSPLADGAAAPDHASVTTYYRFIVEDIDGFTFAGTLSLDSGGETPSATEGVAWSLPGLLHDEADAAHLLLDDGHDATEAASGGLPVESHVEFMGSDSYDDDLVQLIVQSQNS